MLKCYFVSWKFWFTLCYVTTIFFVSKDRSKLCLLFQQETSRSTQLFFSFIIFFSKVDRKYMFLKLMMAALVLESSGEGRNCCYTNWCSTTAITIVFWRWCFQAILNLCWSVYSHPHTGSKTG